MPTALGGVSPDFGPVTVLSAVLLIVLLVALVVLAERNARRQRGNGLKRGRSERNAMGRFITGLTRWGGGGGGI